MAMPSARRLCSRRNSVCMVISSTFSFTRKSPARNEPSSEVDIVLEEGGARLAGVEVKAAASVSEADLRGLRRLRAAAGKHFVAGVVLYDGEATIAFGDGLFAVPVRALWE